MHFLHEKMRNGVEPFLTCYRISPDTVVTVPISCPVGTKFLPIRNILTPVVHVMSNFSILTLPTVKAGGFLFLPPLHWQIPYGTAMSYTVSTGYLYTVPACPAVQFSYLYACIRIPVINCMTPGALPDTNAQIFHQRIPIATGTAGLAARIHRWYFADFISIPHSFIFQHFEKLCPRNTGYRLCQFMVPDHSLYMQVFNADGLVFTHQHR